MSKTETVELKRGDSIMKMARQDAKWLGVIDIVDSAPLVMTIERIVYVKNAQFSKGRTESKLALEFPKSQKRLLLNATNTRSIHDLLGNDPSEIAGKRITLQVVKLDREFNGSTHGIRIGPAAPPEQEPGQ